MYPSINATIGTIEEINSSEVDYSILLTAFAAEYNKSDYYLQVGDISKDQGWILHITAVVSQISDLLIRVVPELLREKVAFKIPENKEVARGILNGSMGEIKIGKVVTIYPDDDAQAIKIAKVLIGATKGIKGPAILTDVHLGSVVYARYGSFKPIVLKDVNGRKENYMLNSQGGLVKDYCFIPFKMPVNIFWPFKDITSVLKPISRQILKKIYKPTSILKLNVRGNVLKGIYVRNIFRTAPCVIKQGIENMFSEDDGRDIRHRLEWQYNLHNSLQQEILLPKAIDLFQEGGDTYFIMEYIDGQSLFDRLKEINYDFSSWVSLPDKEKRILLNYLINILSIIESLHQKGYVHRDIVPGNFMLDMQDRIILIDVELAYSINSDEPDPPFQLGTTGYMSPEQQAVQKPTVKEDIYGLGALLLTVFTGLSPVKFDTLDRGRMLQNLFFFIGDMKISELVTDCLSYDPVRRPDIGQIKGVLTKSTISQPTQKGMAIQRVDNKKLSNTELQLIISSALKSLCTPTMAFSGDLWYSKVEAIENGESVHQKEYSRFGGIYKGIPGVLYLLAFAKQKGFDIVSCQKSYKKGWNYIHNNLLQNMSGINPGLYSGAAGIALALNIGIKAGLLEDNIENRKILFDCLSVPTDNFDLASGICGQGIARLSSYSYFSDNDKSLVPDRYIKILLDSQQKDGSWITSEAGHPSKSLGFGVGVAGIVWFLLQYIIHHKTHPLENAILKGLNWIRKQTSDLTNLSNSSSMTQFGTNFNDVRLGNTLVFMKAYEILQDTSYKRICETALEQYPARLVNNNLSLGTGISGLGEVYLEANKIFGSDLWKERADWVANHIIHTAILENGLAYWMLDDNGKPTADLMVGCGGIIHFLIQYFCAEHSRVTT